MNEKLFTTHGFSERIGAKPEKKLLYKNIEVESGISRGTSFEKSSFYKAFLSWFKVKRIHLTLDYNSLEQNVWNHLVKLMFGPQVSTYKLVAN